MSLFSKAFSRLTGGTTVSQVASVAAKVAPVIPGVGPTLGTALSIGSSLFGPSAQAAPAQTLAAPPTPMIPMTSAGALPMASRIAIGAGRSMAAAPGVLRTATGRMSGVILASGTRISRKRAVALAKRVGLEAAATALGIGMLEMAQMVAEEAARPRRRRGISGTQLASAKRVIRTIKCMHRDLGLKGTTTRRRTC